MEEPGSLTTGPNCTHLPASLPNTPCAPWELEGSALPWQVTTVETRTMTPRSSPWPSPSGVVPEQRAVPVVHLHGARLR